MDTLRYDLSFLEDPEVFAAGRLHAFSDHESYADEAEAAPQKCGALRCL